MRWCSRYFGLICGLAVLACGCASAQQYNFQSYRQSEGLGNVSVARIAFDHNGFLWVATENGLYRFLGSRFERYGIEQGLREREIRDVFVDPAGRIWAATYENLYRWNGRGFEPFDKTPTPVWGAGRIAAADDHHLLLIRRRELVEFVLDPAGKPVSERPFYSAEQRKNAPELAAPTSVMVTPNGTVWMGCRYKICSTQQGQVKVWGASEGVPALAENQDFWWGFETGSDGAVWAVSARKVIELERGSMAFVDRRIPGVELSGNTALSPILKDRQGAILRTTNEGLARWDGVSWQRIGERNGLPEGGPVNSLAQDGNGDLWMGTASSGVWQWRGYENWEGWKKADGLPDNSIWSFDWRNSTHVLIGTERGPAELNTATQRITPMFPGRTWDYGQVSGLSQDRRGQIWASTWTGKLLKIAPDSRRVTPTGDFQWLSFGSVIRPDGGLLFHTKAGVYAVDNPQIPSLPHLVPEVEALTGGKKPVEAHCAASNGDIWFLSGNELLRLRAGRWSRAKIRGPQFEGSTVAGIGCSRDGTVWIDGRDASKNPGIWHLRETKTSLDAANLEALGMEAVRVPAPAFLQEMELLSLLVDRRGWLWIGTDVGVAVWNGSEWRHFTQQNGLIWNDTNQAVLQEAPDGTIWIGTSGGAAHVLHPETLFAPTTLPLAITSIQRYNQTFLPGEDIVFSWSRAPIRFAFASAAGWNRNALEFHYRISGLNPAWITTQELEVALPSLPPGDYRFEVFARNPESGIASAVASVPFRVLAPWWLRWWFLGICIVTVATLLWLLLWLRTRHLVARQRKLEALVKERTHELEASQAALRIQATHDALTGLFNRAVILDLLDQEMARMQREGRMMAVLLVDIDHFKRVNDTYGHLAGDAVLRCFAEKLSKSIRTYDHVGRYGGEEFLMLVGNLPLHEAEERLTGIHNELTNLAVEFDGRDIRITCSIGVSFVLPGGSPLEVSQALSAADKALYEAKRRGRNCVVRAEQSDLAERKMLATHI